MKHSTVGILILLLSAGALIGACSRERPEPRRPALAGRAAGRNVIMISLDTVRADRLGAWGHRVQEVSPSPRLDELMGSGVRFASATAPRALTWPSLASVLTGLYPSSHGVFDNGYNLPDDLPSLATVLQPAGYATGQFLSNMCSANHSGWDQAFCSRGVDSQILPAVAAWLDTLGSKRPFLLWAHYFAAHSPYYNGGDRAQRLLDPGYSGPVVPKKNPLNRIMQDQIPLDETDLRHLDALYDAAIMGSDRLVGQLIDELAQRGLLEDSIVVVFSDHGEDLYDHNGYIYHACSVYQSGLQVPLAFVAPGIIDSGVVSQHVELLDITPTLLDLLGVRTSEVMHGKSLLPYLERPEAGGPGAPAFSEFGDTALHTIVHENWKLVDNPEALSPYCLAGAPENHYPVAEVELYDLEQDPDETRNVATQYPEMVVELRERIRARFEGIQTRLQTQEVPEELKEELRALGYVAN